MTTSGTSRFAGARIIQRDGDQVTYQDASGRRHTEALTNRAYEELRWEHLKAGPNGDLYRASEAAEAEAAARRAVGGPANTLPSVRVGQDGRAKEWVSNGTSWVQVKAGHGFE